MKTTLLLCIICFSIQTLDAQQLNGFDLSETLIPSKEIMKGGPPRDGIPSIDRPEFKKAFEYKEFGNNIQVLGVFYNGVAKAYPIKILDWHEIVNDDFGGKPVVITYCPLCGSGIAFESDIVKDKPTEFGVSGLLYNSDVLLYDRTTQSLWSQILGKAISGPLKGQELQVVNTQRMTLKSWKSLYPWTQILTTNTGYERNYQTSPYGSYDLENRTMFPVAHTNDVLHKKEWVIGIENKGVYKAYSKKRLAKLRKQELQDTVGGETFTLTWDKKAENVVIKNSDGEKIASLQMFWFAWVAFHPDTEVFK